MREGKEQQNDFVPEPGTLVVEDRTLAQGFIQLPKVILHARNLSRDAKLLYAILLSYAWQESSCFPGYSRLCEDMQATEKVVRKYIHELEEVSLLRQRRRGLGKTNIYTLKSLNTANLEVADRSKTPDQERYKTSDQERSKTPVANRSKTPGKLETAELDSGDTVRISKGSPPKEKRRTINGTSSQQDTAVLGLTPPTPMTATASDVLTETSTQADGVETMGQPLHPRGSTTGFTRLRDVLPSRSPSLFASSAAGHPDVSQPPLQPIPRTDLPTSITTVAREFLEQERGTPEHIRGTLARLTTLYHAAGLDDDAFLGVVIEAKEVARTGRPPTRITRFVTQVTDRVRSLQLAQLAEHHHSGGATPAQSPVQPQRRAGKDRQHLLAFIKDFSVEFGDEAPLASSVTRAQNLYHRSGLSLEQFTSLLYEARALTKEHMGGITKEQHPTNGTRSLWGRGTNSMPYFYACLEGLLTAETDQDTESQAH